MLALSSKSRTFIHNISISGKYERSHRIDLPKSSNGWQIRVRRITANANVDNILDKMYIEAITEVIDQKFTYPHTTLLGLQYDAKTFNRIAKVAVRAKGKLINIPSNYNSVSNTYTGVWNGQFKYEYSNNPAWIFYDLVTSERYGLGRRIDKSMIDKWALYEIGTYCDENVDDGEGGLEKRYTCNVYLQKQEDAYKILSQLSGIFRGLTYWNGQQLVVSADVPKDPTYTFSRANVVDGNFEYIGTRARDRHTVAKVAFDNPNENFKTEYEYIRDEAGIAKYGINTIDISAIGCTTRGQAQRAGLWALKAEQLETRTVSFSTGLEGFNIAVGDVIEVSDELLAGRANGGRVIAVAADLKTVTIDRDAIVKVNDFISINGESLQRRKVTAVSGRVVTVLTPFIGIEAGSVWAVSSSDLNVMQFRILSIKPNEDQIHTITAIQHEPLKYDAVDNGADVKPTKVSILVPSNILAPESVSISSTYKVVQSQTVATLVIQWSQVKDARGYIVEWRRDSGNWIKIPLTSNVSTEVEGIYSGNYQVRVKSVNVFDVESNYMTSAITTIAGKVGTPKSLSSISATGILFGMDLKWNFATGQEDTNYTEIETATSSSGANNSLLGQFSYPTNKTTINGLQGGLKVYYRGRIADKLGNVSAWSNWVSGTTSADATKVLNLLEGQITESQLYTDLSTKINQIDINKSAIESIDFTEVNDGIAAAEADIAQAKADIVKAKSDITKAKTDIVNSKTEIDQAKVDITANKTIIDTTKADVTVAKTDIVKAKSDITKSNTDITKAKTDIIAAQAKADAAKLLADANKIDLVAVNKAVGDNKTSVDSSITTLTNKDTALTNLYTALNSEYGINKAKVVADLKTLTDKDISLSSLLTTLTSNYDTNKAAVTASLTTLTNKDTALTNSVNTLTTNVGKNSTAISVETTARSDADTALTNSISTLSSAYATNKASVTQSLTTLTNKDTALTNSLTSLTTTVGNNGTAITNETTARTNADSALSSRITTNLAKADNALGRISTVETLSASNKQSIANTKSELTATYDNLKIGGTNLLVNTSSTLELITIESSFRTVRFNIALEELDLKPLDTITASIRIDKQSVAGCVIRISFYRADGTYSWKLGSNIAKGTTGVISITEEIPSDCVYMNLIINNQSYVDGLEEELGDIYYSNLKLERGNKATDWTPSPKDIDSALTTNKASIESEATTRANADDTITNSVTALTSSYNTNKAAVTASLSTLTSKDVALTNSINTLTTNVGKNTTAVSTEATARTNADSALGLRVDTVTATAGTNKTAISTETTARSSADNALGLRIDTVTATAGTNKTAISSETTARTNADSALGLRIDTVTATAGTNKTSISTETTARVNADSALSSRITTAQSKADSAFTKITNEAVTIASNSQAIAANKLELKADFDGIQIGGRNYLDDSEFKNNLWRLSTSDSGGAAVLTGNVVRISGTNTGYKQWQYYAFADGAMDKVGDGVYTYSVEARHISGTDKRAWFTIREQLDTGNGESNSNHVDLTSEWKRYSITFTSNRGADFQKYRAILASSYINTIEYRLPKLEKGTRFTDWSVAPEDLDKLITSNSTSITSEATARSNADNALGLRVDTVTATAGTNKTSISTEVTARTNADSALSSRITTNLTKADNALSRISTAENTIASNTQSIAKTKTDLTASFNGIQIGGRNLLRDSTLLQGTQYWRTWGSDGDNQRSIITLSDLAGIPKGFKVTYVSGGDYGFAQDDVLLVPNTEYILSAWYNTPKPVTVILQHGNGSDDPYKSTIITAVSDGEWHRITKTWKTSNDVVDTNFYIGVDSISSSGHVYFGGFKLEKGNIASDWSPNPEDTDIAISGNTAAISKESATRATAIGAVASDVTTLQTRVERGALLGADLRTFPNGWTSVVGADNSSYFSTNNFCAIISSPNLGKDSGYNGEGRHIYNEGIKVNRYLVYKVSAETYIARGDAKSFIGVAGVTAAGRLVDSRGYLDSPTYQYYVDYHLKSEDSGWKKIEAYVSFDQAALNAIDTNSPKILLSDFENTTEKRIEFLRPMWVANYQGSIGYNQLSYFTIEALEGANEAKIQQSFNTVDGLSAQTTLKLDVNGYVSGMGQYNNGTTSQFAVRADNFYIANPSTKTASIPFQVNTSASTVNGVSVPAGTYIKDAYISNGTITNAKIANAAITNAKIGNLAVDTAQIATSAIENAKIANGAITTAKIGTAQVDSLQLKGEAVIVPRVQFTASDFNFSSIDTEEVINSITINADGGGVSISFGFERLYAYINKAGTNPAVTLRIKRGNTVLRTLRYEEFNHSGIRQKNTTSNQGNTYITYSAMLLPSGSIRAENITLPTILDTPPTGNQTYTVTLESRGLNSGKDSSDTADSPVIITARSLHIIGAKR